MMSNLSPHKQYQSGLFTLIYSSHLRMPLSQQKFYFVYSHIHTRATLMTIPKDSYKYKYIKRHSYYLSLYLTWSLRSEIYATHILFYNAHHNEKLINVTARINLMPYITTSRILLFMRTSAESSQQ
jgi:hypothetical protein